ncbi:hypothetical protein [Photobacterium lutimaris]|uniref:Uncharacterized protein n=1 Tax=Photobacterium lutimaris TaxID=388278 RepID=A0A2T3J4Y9_9GAMM|nr:hypothetical protein [Photobacterium lutimaris]PSU36345.1 hypothetical protein C9I99_04955 [Photobacterium lutimaris]TDR74760.1 hypothetical protein DFP78_10691 [Photobacterium lutimaris]
MNMNKKLLATIIATTLSTNVLAQAVDVGLVSNSHQGATKQQKTMVNEVSPQTKNINNEGIKEVDGVVYEQESTGFWAAIGAGTLGLTAALLSGSSSSGAGDDDVSGVDGDRLPGDKPEDGNKPDGGLPGLPIVQDVEGKGWVVGETNPENGRTELLKDGVHVASVDEDGAVRSNGQEIGTWKAQEDGTYVLSINDKTVGATVNKDGSINVDYVAGDRLPGDKPEDGNKPDGGLPGSPIFPDFERVTLGDIEVDSDNQAIKVNGDWFYLTVGDELVNSDGKRILLSKDEFNNITLHSAQGDMLATVHAHKIANDKIRLVDHVDGSRTYIGESGRMVTIDADKKKALKSKMGNLKAQLKLRFTK